jgi:hypothetical protein
MSNIKAPAEPKRFPHMGLDSGRSRKIFRRNQSTGSRIRGDVEQ